METRKICGLCMKERSLYIISETCSHKLCNLCFSNSVTEKLSSYGLPFPCPVSNCTTSFPFSFLQTTLSKITKEKFENLMKDLRSCNCCLKVSRSKKLMKKLKCKHYCCEECEKQLKCLQCSKEKFLRKNEERISSKKPLFDTQEKKRTCEKCTHMSSLPGGL